MRKEWKNFVQKKYGYARVSSKEQNLDRQIDALRKYVVSERDIITDKESGKDFDRQGWQMLRGQLLRDGDTLYIASLDRLGRNKAQVLEEMQALKNLGVRLVVLDLPTTMMDVPDKNKWVIDMINALLIEVMTTIAEQERHTIRQRQAEGIAAAQARGKKLGRPAAEFPSDWARIYGIWKNGGISAAQAMQELDMKRSTFYKLVKEWEKDGSV